MVLAPAQVGPAIAGEEMTIEIIVANESSEPVYDVGLEFEVEEPGRFISASLARGSCERTSCEISSFGGNESVNGTITIVQEPGFDTDARLDGSATWRQNDSRMRYAYFHTTIQMDNSNLAGGLVWATGPVGNSLSNQPPWVDPQAIYASFGEKLLAISRDSGEELWEAETGLSSFGLIMSEGRVFVRADAEDDDGRSRRGPVKSLDALTGELVWQQPLDGYTWGSALVYDNSLFFNVTGPARGKHEGYSYLTSLDVSTGELNWEQRFDGEHYSPPVEHGGIIYIATRGSRPEYIYAIEPESGAITQLHQTTFGTREPLLFADGKVVMLSEAEIIFAIDFSTGEEVWRYKPYGRVFQAPVFFHGKVYLFVFKESVNDYAAVHVLDAETGEFQWKYEPSRALTAYTVLGDLLYVSSYLNLAVLDANTGDHIWETGFVGIYSPLAEADGILYGQGFAEAGGFQAFAINAYRGP